MVRSRANRIDPSGKWELYTASNSSNFGSGLSASIYVKTDGDVACVDEDGTVVIWPGLKGGNVYPIIAKRINATGSTNTGAGEFVILY